jgi:hypothetical protein
MPVPNQPMAYLRTGEEDQTQAEPGVRPLDPEADRGGSRQERGDWPAYSMDILTTFFDP